MRNVIRLLGILSLISVPLSTVFAANPPNLTGKWQSVELKELPQTQLTKMNGDVKKSIVTGKIEATIQQHDRFLVMNSRYELSEPVALEPGGTQLTSQGTETTLCVIGQDNSSLYCVDSNEPSHLLGKIINGHKIEFVQMEDSRHNDAFVLHKTLEKR